MARLSVYTLEPETLHALRLQAAKHGVSIKEEVRQILKRSVHSQHSIGHIALNLFGPEHGIDLNLSQYSTHQPSDLSE
jgi:plasmid stability protein